MFTGRRPGDATAAAAATSRAGRNCPQSPPTTQAAPRGAVEMRSLRRRHARNKVDGRQVPLARATRRESRETTRDLVRRMTSSTRRIYTRDRNRCRFIMSCAFVCPAVFVTIFPYRVCILRHPGTASGPPCVCVCVCVCVFGQSCSKEITVYLPCTLYDIHN